MKPAFVDLIRQAAQDKTALRLRGSGSKDFYGQLHGNILDTRSYAGIIDYDPTELVITARCGTPLTEIESVLQAKEQMLGFEPPHFGPAATLGGCIATGLSGPRRASSGAARDFVLGICIIDGRGNELAFGGRVMKNVAGYDISRLMVGSLGTLGLITEISLKTLPLPRAETTLQFEASQADALKKMNQWAAQPWPISATYYENNLLRVRLSGPNNAIQAAKKSLGGEELKPSEQANFWLSVREQQLDFFQSDVTLWRLSLPSTTLPLNLVGSQLIEWNGALRWLKSDADASIIRNEVQKVGGHAIRFRAGNNTNSLNGLFHPLSPSLLKIHKNLKNTFDPEGIFNRGKMYPEI